MTKRDLIEEIANRYPAYSRRDAEIIVNTIFESMTEALCNGDRIEIRGFGSFVVRHRDAREGRNPKTGDIVAVSAKKVPFFKVGKELKLRIGCGFVDGSLSSERQAAESLGAELDSGSGFPAV